MTRRLAPGRPGTAVIPVDWGSHGLVLERAMTATCSIRHPGGSPGVFDPVTGDYTGGTANSPHTVTSCRVQALSGVWQDRETGEQLVTVMSYQVTIPATAGNLVTVGDLLTVTDPGPTGDTTLTGRGLTVRGVVRGTVVWERDLYATDDLG
jgi:hypothetical protein